MFNFLLLAVLCAVLVLSFVLVLRILFVVFVFVLILVLVVLVLHRNLSFRSLAYQECKCLSFTLLLFHS